MDWHNTITQIDDPGLQGVLARAQKAAWCDIRKGWRVAMPLALQGPWQDLVELLEDRDAVALLRRAGVYSLGTFVGAREFVELRVGGGRA